MDTPYITHILAEDYEHIYEPAEDSFLMIDALESDLNFIKNLNPTVCVEIGSGSGINITALANVIKNQSFFIATDINPYATKMTKSTAAHNDTTVDSIQMDLVTLFIPNSIDVLIFNPPYVPTTTSSSSNSINTSSHQTHDEKNFDDTIDLNLIKSWAGGINGREVMDRVINSLDSILSATGVFYLLALKENNIEDIIETLRKIQFQGKIIAERKIRGEHLFVIKIVRI